LGGYRAYDAETDEYHNDETQHAASLLALAAGQQQPFCSCKIVNASATVFLFG
jgi:hypothetical protein